MAKSIQNLFTSATQLEANTARPERRGDKLAYKKSQGYKEGESFLNLREESFSAEGQVSGG